MIYVTGDTHGTHDFAKLLDNKYKKLTKNDFMIICGDCGAVFDRDSSRVINLYEYLPYTVLFVDGNHENFDMLNSYPIEIWNCGKVHKISNSVYHLMLGQVYCLDGIKFFCFGGALSFDKSRRIRGKTWWEAELPTKEDYYEAVNNLKTFKNQVDFVITHDCPLSWMGGVKDSPKLIHEGYIQSSSNIFLEEIASNLHFRHWFFGHYHIDVKLTPIATELFHNVVNISRYISYPVRYGKDYVGSNSRWNIPTM